ncbi:MULTISPECIES: GNAT family N-acetyltransferase [unclassified Acinetobacter]|uniref:GNAT family N-acetyltransferase n=1 Tax=unclassified Acinetobacter TaxID=196816 RepID=UPI001C24DB38|nr:MULTISPECIES: GNAT family N-acetyltransferase [unclassified Acinetobacter]
MSEDASFQIKKYEDSDKIIWNEFLLTCKNYHFIFNRDFMEYHSDRFEDCSLIFKNDKNKIMALLPGNIKDNIFYSHQGLTFGGFLINRGLHAADILELFTQLKIFLKEKNIEKIIYKCIPIIYHNYPAQEDLYALFINHANLYRRDISTSIYLEEEYSYSASKRRSIEKLKKNGISCEEVEQPSVVWGVLREVLHQHHNQQPVHNEIEIDLLKNRFPNNIRAYKCCFEGQIVAAAVTFETDRVVHTQYLASNNKGREERVLDYLIDFLINKSKKVAKIFDFGTSNENEGKFLNKGLIYQKERFGARAIVHDYYNIDL